MVGAREWQLLENSRRENGRRWRMVGTREWQSLENGKGQPIWLGTLLAGKSLLGAVCSWKDSPGSSLLLGTVCSRERFLWNSFLGALSRDSRPRNPFNQDFHPGKSPHPPSTLQVFIPTSIYGQPRLEWWIQLDEQFAYAPTLFLPLHISSCDLLNPTMESPSVPTVHNTPLAKVPFQKSSVLGNP
jgi:hypothetical protein